MLRRLVSLLQKLVPILIVLSVVLSVSLVQFLVYGDGANLHSVSTDYVVELLSELNLIGLLALPDFWALFMDSGIWLNSDFAAYLSAYCALSLIIFSAGLVAYHHFIIALPKQWIAVMFLTMGWLHMLVAKGVLLFSLPMQLVGPVFSIGVLSLLYFSLLGLAVDF